jgi:hypothetical protein
VSKGIPTKVDKDAFAGMGLSLKREKRKCRIEFLVDNNVIGFCQRVTAVAYPCQSHGSFPA